MESLLLAKKVLSVEALRERYPRTIEGVKYEDDDYEYDDDADKSLVEPVTKAKEVQVIYISSASSSSSSCSEEEDTPSPGSIMCLKKMEDMKLYEETEDCFILDFDPTESIDFSKLSVSENPSTISDDNELSVVSETGKVACRDYPHSRHLCVKFPFNTTSHQLHCEMCYCYVCDTVAPCKYWTEPLANHCHASESGESWRFMRTITKLRENLIQ